MNYILGACRIHNHNQFISMTENGPEFPELPAETHFYGSVRITSNVLIETI